MLICVLNILKPKTLSPSFYFAFWKSYFAIWEEPLSEEYCVKKLPYTCNNYSHTNLRSATCLYWVQRCCYNVFNDFEDEVEDFKLEERNFQGAQQRRFTFFLKVLFLVLFGVISSFTWFFPLLQWMVFQGYDFSYFLVYFLVFSFCLLLFGVFLGGRGVSQN